MLAIALIVSISIVATSILALVAISIVASFGIVLGSMLTVCLIISSVSFSLAIPAILFTRVVLKEYSRIEHHNQLLSNSRNIQSYTQTRRSVGNPHETNNHLLSSITEETDQEIANDIGSMNCFDELTHEIT